MCGIFGVIVPSAQNYSSEQLTSTIEQLFVLSETRGREAAGISFLTDESIYIYKDSVSASQMIKDRSYLSLWTNIVSEVTSGESTCPLAVVGHSRLVTNGLQGIDANNQPISKEGTVVVHNGIIVNDNSLWSDNSELVRTASVDTEIIVALLNSNKDRGVSLPESVRRVFHDIQGESSVAIQMADMDCICLATNTGSIYFAISNNQSMLLFASEKYILKQLIASGGIPDEFDVEEIDQVAAGEAVLIGVTTLSLTRFSLCLNEVDAVVPEECARAQKSARTVSDREQDDKVIVQSLTRCTRCLLPESMPYISFDQGGVCNYCLTYESVELKGESALETLLTKHRRQDGSPDCLVAFSGGRDSSYALHLLKTELGMNPIAYTYDWGMVTDLARRNQARLCGKLGVEHIWVSADIKAKRKNIKRNVDAWMRRPDLGMIPLFMAGDKQFFYHAHKVMEQTGIELMVFATNHYEKTDFKIGFCGVPPIRDEKRPNILTASQKFGLIRYYIKQYLLNPAYINLSLLDTLDAFVSYYMLDNETRFLHLFDYLEWNEEEIDRVLIDEYGWETAEDSSSTWRIGDGTAAFYNFIYRTVTGFSEQETFRSNQIRSGVITREEGGRLVEAESNHRFESIREYCNLVGVDFDEILRVVNNMPRHYRGLV